jgi:hypothetical protein
MEGMVMQAESLVEHLIEEEFEGIELRSYAEKQLFKHHEFEQLADAIEKRAKRRLWIGAAIALAAATLGITKLVVGPGLSSESSSYRGAWPFLDGVVARSS